MSVHDCLVGALLALASGKAERRQVHPPGRTPIKNLPQMSQMRTDLEGMASCHTHAATKLSSHRSHRTLRSLTICEHL